MAANAQSSYIKALKKRGAESHIYRKYQLTGLMIAEALHDEAHKSLYIKLVKEGNGERLLRLAKEVAEIKGVKNRGAYFMTLLKSAKNNEPGNPCRWK